MAPTPVLLPGRSHGRIHGVAKSQTRLSDFTVTFCFRALEKEMASHSRVLAWRIPGMGEPGGLRSMGLHRVRHDWSNLAAAAAASTKQETVHKKDCPNSPNKDCIRWVLDALDDCIWWVQTRTVLESPEWWWCWFPSFEKTPWLCKTPPPGEAGKGVWQLTVGQLHLVSVKGFQNLSLYVKWYWSVYFCFSFARPGPYTVSDPSQENRQQASKTILIHF